MKSKTSLHGGSSYKSVTPASTMESPPPYAIVGARGIRKSQTNSSMLRHNVSGPRTMVARNTSSKKKKCKYCTYCLGSLLVFLSSLMIISLTFPYPLHASCIVKWKFGEQCNYVMQKLRWQIKDWSNCNDCGPYGSKCLYTLLDVHSFENNVIKARHMTPNWKMTSEIKITFENSNNNTCIATGVSTSNEWFMIFDYGLNYCNLHDLIIGANLDKHPCFLELTGNVVCTQYSMTACGVRA